MRTILNIHFYLLDAGSVVKLVAWLEDRKIRVYKIEERGALRTSNITWKSVFAKVGSVQRKALIVLCLM